MWNAGTARQIIAPKLNISTKLAIQTIYCRTINYYWR
jgi:hypothetical protein